jgi:hypothetical protein
MNTNVHLRDELDYLLFACRVQCSGDVAVVHKHLCATILESLSPYSERFLTLDVQEEFPT